MANSKTKSLADLVVTAINSWVTTSPPWPTFVAAFAWLPAHKLEALASLTVNVAPAALTGSSGTRKHLDRSREIAVQIAQQLAATEAAAITQIDNLLALIEQLDLYLFSEARVLGAEYSLLQTKISSFDWDLALNKRCFHAVNILTYKSMES